MSPAEQETVLVMLARMEGKLDLVGQRVADIVPRVERHETEISELKLAVQSLEEGAVARDKTVLATAAALKLAREEKEASSERGWSPVAKVVTALGSLAVLWSLLDAVAKAVG